MSRFLLFVIATLFVLPAWSQGSTEADQRALRQLKSDITTAVTRRDFAAAEKVLHQPFMATLITQEAFTDMPGMKRYYDSLFTRNDPRMKDIQMAAEVDGLSQIITGTFALNKGSTAERYELADGRVFNMKGRWTAVSLKEPDGSWKLLAVHTGVNFLDNPVIDTIEGSLLWTSAASLGIGLLAGLLVGWFIWSFRRRRRVG